jgi:hemin uptake protein HemP
MSVPDPNPSPHSASVPAVDLAPIDLAADEPESSDPQPALPARYSSAPPPIRLFRSEELFAGGRLVCIEHAGSTYRLQITARGKLILQK